MRRRNPQDAYLKQDSRCTAPTGRRRDPRDKKAVALPLHGLASICSVAQIDVPHAHDALAKTRVAIFGLEGPGAVLATQLMRLNIGSLTLIDPYPCHAQDLSLLPMLRPADINRPRQDALARVLKAMGGMTKVTSIGDRKVTAALVDRLARHTDFLVGCFDRSFLSANHWINRAALKWRKPAFFADVSGATATIGPLVLPGNTACFMCYRMHVLANARELGPALSREEELDAQRYPRLYERDVLPAASMMAAAALESGILQHLLGTSSHSLAGRIIVINAMALHTETHVVLEQPFCPECKKKVARAAPPDLADLRDQAEPVTNIADTIQSLVSRRVGLVSRLELAQKGNREPRRPYLSLATLSNFQLVEGNDGRIVTAGKGASASEAQVSALGEAIEHYCAMSYDTDGIIHATRARLGDDSVDPRDLVLFRDEQYERVPYARYDDHAEIGWIPARSLISQRLRYAPACAVLLDYAGTAAESLFPLSSSGLAAGGSLADAVVRATFEVIERDAFVVAWLNRLSGRRVDPLSHPDQAVRNYCIDLDRRGAALHLVALPTDSPALVFIAIIQRDDGRMPAAVVGLGCNLDACEAARAAIWEAEQVRNILIRQLRLPRQQERLAHLIADPKAVADVDDHSLLYCSDQQIPQLQFLLTSPMTDIDWSRGKFTDSRRKLEILLEHFASEGQDLLYVDVTSRDVAKLGLRVARVLIPGYQPMHFGLEARLGGQRLFDLPVKLGIRGIRAQPSELNPHPHPLG